MKQGGSNMQVHSKRFLEVFLLFLFKRFSSAPAKLYSIMMLCNSILGASLGGGEYSSKLPNVVQSVADFSQFQLKYATSGVACGVALAHGSA